MNEKELTIVDVLPINEFSRAKITVTVSELQKEKEMAASLGLGPD